MMIRYVTLRACLLLVALPLLWSCAESYPSLEYDKTQGRTGIENQDDWSTRTPIHVFVNRQEFFSMTAAPSSHSVKGITRGMGAFEGEDGQSDAEKWAKDSAKLSAAVFYLFSFRDGRNLQGVLTERADMTQTAFAEGHAHDDDNSDCLIDGVDYGYGNARRLYYRSSGELLSLRNEQKQIYMDNGDTAEGGDVEQFYYSSTYQDEPYNFYAYYIDNASETVRGVHRESDSIYYDLQIDGTQDIMCGSAPRFGNDAWFEDRYEDVWKYGGLTREEKNKIISIGSYCSYAAHRGIQPQVDMSHQLTRLRFLAYPAAPSADSITITGVTVHSVTTGRLVVAHQDPAHVKFLPDAQKGQMQLRDPSPDGKSDCPEFTPRFVKPFDKTKHWSEQDSIHVGGSLMCVPDSVLDITLHYTQRMKNGPVRERNLSSTYRVRPPKTANNMVGKGNEAYYMFKQGLLYDIYIAVYGLEQILVTANIEGWKPGGDISINPDEDSSLLIDESME